MIQHKDERFLSPEVLLALHHYLETKDVFEWQEGHTQKPGKEEQTLAKEMLKLGKGTKHRSSKPAHLTDCSCRAACFSAVPDLAHDLEKTN